jgi:hypothetical protein
MSFFQFLKNEIKNNLAFLMATVLASVAAVIGVSLVMALWALVVGYSWGATDGD